MPNTLQANGAQPPKPTKFNPFDAGTTFGKWTVRSYVGKGSYECVCDCGVERLISSWELVRGTRTRGCRRCTSGYPEGLCEIYYTYKRNARVRELEFSLTREDLLGLATRQCYYCQSLSKPYGGVDRRDNSVGYVLENCVPCCSLCNHMKCDLSVENFLGHVRKIARS
jgi:hypothetical protein